ncbi:unnamed protein product [Rhizopus stolonifer]
MQQLIQQRITTHSLLKKAQVLSNTWVEVHSKSLSILQSICNIISQQKSTLDLPKLVESHGVSQQNLVFKQTESLGILIRKLEATIELLKNVCDSWNSLKLEVDRFIVKVLQRPEPTLQPLSTESMLQVVSVDPIELYEMVGCIAHSYSQEYKYKSSLFDNISSHLSTPKEACNLLELWQADSHVAKKTEQRLLERIKLFNITKKVLESVD